MNTRQCNFISAVRRSTEATNQMGGHVNDGGVKAVERSMAVPQVLNHNPRFQT